MGKPTFILKKIDTIPLTIHIAIPAEKPILQGSFVGHAKRRTKAENKALFEQVEAGKFEGDEEGIIRELYDRFEGLGNAAGEPVEGEDAMVEVCTGEYSAYLTPACVQAYYEQYNEAKQGNSKGRRGR